MLGFNRSDRDDACRTGVAVYDAADGAASRLDDATSRLLGLVGLARSAGGEAQSRALGAVDGALDTLDDTRQRAWRLTPFGRRKYPGWVEAARLGALYEAAQLGAKAGGKAGRGAWHAGSDMAGMSGKAAGGLVDRLSFPTPDVPMPFASRSRFSLPDVPTPSAPKLSAPGFSMPRLALPEVALPEVSAPRFRLPKMVAERVCPPPPTFTVAGLAAGLAIGAAVMFLADPVAGARRRQLIMDKAGRWFRQGRREIGGQATDLQNRARGTYHELRHLGGSHGEAEPADGRITLGSGTPGPLPLPGDRAWSAGTAGTMDRPAAGWREAPSSAGWSEGRDGAVWRDHAEPIPAAGTARFNAGGAAAERDTRSTWREGEAGWTGRPEGMLARRADESAAATHAPFVPSVVEASGVPQVADTTLATGMPDSAASPERDTRADRLARDAVPVAATPDTPLAASTTTAAPARDDDDIVDDVEAALLANPVTQATAPTNIKVISRACRVTLTGVVPNPVVRMTAAEVAAAVPGVSSVDNQLEIGQHV